MILHGSFGDDDIVEEGDAMIRRFINRASKALEEGRLDEAATLERAASFISQRLDIHDPRGNARRDVTRSALDVLGKMVEKAKASMGQIAEKACGRAKPMTHLSGLGSLGQFWRLMKKPEEFPHPWREPYSWDAPPWLDNLVKDSMLKVTLAKKALSEGVPNLGYRELMVIRDLMDSVREDIRRGAHLLSAGSSGTEPYETWRSGQYFACPSKQASPIMIMINDQAREIRDEAQKRLLPLLWSTQEMAPHYSVMAGLGASRRVALDRTKNMISERIQEIRTELLMDPVKIEDVMQTLIDLNALVLSMERMSRFIPGFRVIARAAAAQVDEINREMGSTIRAEEKMMGPVSPEDLEGLGTDVEKLIEDARQMAQFRSTMHSGYVSGADLSKWAAENLIRKGINNLKYGYYEEAKRCAQAAAIQAEQTLPKDRSKLMKQVISLSARSL